VSGRSSGAVRGLLAVDPTETVKRDSEIFEDQERFAVVEAGHLPQFEYEDVTQVVVITDLQNHGNAPGAGYDSDGGPHITDGDRGL
jgi:hypothetical protein